MGDGDDVAQVAEHAAEKDDETDVERVVLRDGEQGLRGRKCRHQAVCERCDRDVTEGARECICIGLIARRKYHVRHSQISCGALSLISIRSGSRLTLLRRGSTSRM